MSMQGRIVRSDPGSSNFNCRQQGDALFKVGPFGIGAKVGRLQSGNCTSSPCEQLPPLECSRKQQPTHSSLFGPLRRCKQTLIDLRSTRYVPGSICQASAWSEPSHNLLYPGRNSREGPKNTLATSGPAEIGILDWTGSALIASRKTASEAK